MLNIVLERSKNQCSFQARGRTDADDEFVDDKLSARILKQAQQQQQELEEEAGTNGSGFKVLKFVYNLLWFLKATNDF